MHKIFCLSIFWSFLFSHTADHLIIIKVITQPDEAESFSIYNPTDSPIALDSVYICDSKNYYKIQTGGTTSNPYTDFTAKFPAVSITPGDTLHIVLNDNYSESYGNDFVPDLVMFLDHTNSMIETKTEPSSFGVSSNRINEFAEMLILFSWDGKTSSVIQDIDYFLWGNTNNAVSKDIDDGFQYNDTPMENQHPIRTYTHSDIMDSAYVRIGIEEIGEISPGNGITYHDETSEDFLLSWEIVVQKEVIWGCTDNTAANFNPLATVDDTTCTNSFEAIIDGNYDCSENSLDYCSSDKECPSIKIQGLMVDYFDVTIYNGPHSITLEDENGYRIELSIWPSVWDLENDPLGYFINAPFNRFLIQAEGSVFEYDGNKQVLICEPENATVLSEVNFSGEYEASPGSKIDITPEPYVLLPAYGETLDFSYSFPDNSRVIIRIFDLSGRFVTSLVDQYYQDSGNVQMNVGASAWDGRDNLGQIVPPGTYIMHIEAMNPVTGETYTDAAPIVVGVKN